MATPDNRFLQALGMGKMVQDCITSAEFIYGDRWLEVKAKYKKILEDHHQEHKTTSLLGSAIALSKEDDAKLQLVLIASAF